MKTMIATALIATAAITGAASAQQVTPGALGAIAHFNESREGGDVISLKAASNGSVSTRASASGLAYERFNLDADSQDGIRGTQGATVVSNSPVFGSDIFAAIRAANAENE
jgi:hypothetical protein